MNSSLRATRNACLRPQHGGLPTPRTTITSLLLTASLLSLGVPARSGPAFQSCFEFFESLEEDESGACADVVFFGFTGQEIADFSGAGVGNSSASIDAFDAFDSLPDFFDPAEPIFSSVEVHATSDATGTTAFEIVHRGRVGMFPLAGEPDVGVPDTSRFIATGSESRVVFEANKPGEIGEISIEIELEQDFEMIDPIDNGASGEMGTFFLIEAVDVETGELIDEFFLAGSSKFDSELDPEPDFEDPFAPGYEGFTNTSIPEPGRANVEFDRTLELDIEVDTDVALTTLQSESIFADGFESGDVSAWSTDSSNTFVFRVSSPDPDVRFTLKVETVGPELVAPQLAVTRQSQTEVRLSWDALNTQVYTILFTTDPSLPFDQWQEMGSVADTAGSVTRDFPITDPQGFFVVSASQ